MTEQRSTRIVVNGQEYASVEEMPADVRAVYERALRLAADANAGGASTGMTASGAGTAPEQVTVSTVRTTTRYIVNGREYGSLDELPPEVRTAVRHAAGGTPALPGARAESTPGENPYAPSTSESTGGKRLRLSLSVSPLRIALWIAAILLLLYVLLRRG